VKAWSWEGFFSYLGNLYLIGGAGMTILLTAITLVLGFILGLALALMRLSKKSPVRWIAQGYIQLFRGTPLLVQLLIIYTALPLIPGIELRFSVFESAILGLALNEAAYLAEIIRAGIQAVPKGQSEAAFSLGLNRRITFREIVLPQAMRVIVPPLGNSVNGLLKTTSLVSVISMEELLRRGQLVMQERFQVLEVYAVIAVFYLVMTTCWEFVQRRIEAHYGRGYGDAGKQLARDDR
jgi:polar amino acid transport system permease protein